MSNILNIKKYFFTLIFMMGTLILWSTHNRAGEITYEQIDNLTIRVTVTTYTKTSSTAADRDSLEIFWGDGTSNFVSRFNGGGDPLPNDVKINKYIAEHTYPGRATYTIYFIDPNRVDGILNVNPPNSVDIRFFLSTTFTFLDPQFQGFNSSAVLLQPPLDFGCVGVPFTHNPNAFDADGDSIAYEMIAPFEDIETSVPNYISIDQIGPGPNNQISLDPVTGTFTWDSPSIPGEYNVAFLVKEYREGILINSIVRDMQILVRTCNNNPPTIETTDEICVIAGEEVNLSIIVDDPDDDQQVFVEATGGPFEIKNPSELFAPPGYSEGPIDVRLRWQTDCNHIFKDYYQIVIRVVDNYFADSTGLATLKTIRIKVMGPPPENLQGESVAGNAILTWNLPYTCENAREDYFQGFSVWRKERSTSLPEDTCLTGLDGLGYVKINFLTTENDGNNYFFVDEDVVPNKTYCYRILAEFALFTQTGNPFNRVESIPSDEICLIVKRDLPFLMEANVITTGNSDGTVRISWIKPDPEDLDTLANPGPYRYQLEYQNDQNWLEIPDANFTVNAFSGEVDTTYLHRNLDTESNQYNYRVQFYTGNGLFGFSDEASTVFLSTQPSDNQITLTWDETTPWVNNSYVILKEDNTGMFNEIATVTTPSYIDNNASNGIETCYIVKSVGSYGVSNIVSPLINNSQKNCNEPEDNVAPCPPLFSVLNNCEDEGELPITQELGNTIIWENDVSCSQLDDIQEFRIYYSIDNENYEVIHSASSFMINEYLHQPESGLAGCYALTALDALGNESEFSQIVCIENCPRYILPNTFTPNGDGANDKYKPRINRFIETVEFNVFNQWGNKVFETNDPALNWDGKNLSGNDLQEGVYYYVCRVFEIRPGGKTAEVEKIKGHINLLR